MHEITLICLAALVAGFVLGWFIGRRLKTVTATETAALDHAYRENAKFDFEFIRNKANDIVRLANEINTRTASAGVTILDPHRNVETKPQLPETVGAVGDPPMRQT